MNLLEYMREFQMAEGNLKYEKDVYIIVKGPSSSSIKKKKNKNGNKKQNGKFKGGEKKSKGN